MKRRDFIGGAIGLATAPTLTRAATAGDRSVVVRARDPQVRLDGERFDATRLARLLDGALMKLTNARDARAAWRALFSPRDVVGLKVNCLAEPPLVTHPVLVDQIVRGLRLAGVPDGNIIVWERFTRELAHAGFTPADAAGAVRVTGIDGRYDSGLTTSGKVGSCLAPMVSSLCTAHVNVPVLKDHLMAGLGVGMKNFYGAIHNPNKYHDNHCSPYVADVSAIPQIRDRLRLVVCDALNVQYDGGPTLRPHALRREDALLLATDPVALDAVAGRMIDEKRAAAGLPSLEAAGRAPAWLRVADGYGLGRCDAARIEVIET